MLLSRGSEYPVIVIAGERLCTGRGIAQCRQSLQRTSHCLIQYTATKHSHREAGSFAPHAHPTISDKNFPRRHFVLTAFINKYSLCFERKSLASLGFPFSSCERFTARYRAGPYDLRHLVLSRTATKFAHPTQRILTGPPLRF